MANYMASSSYVEQDCREFVNRCDRVYVSNPNDSTVQEHESTRLLEYNDEFYLYLDQCTLQTGSLLDSGHADLMFLEDETSTPYLLSQRCLIYRCDVYRVSQGYQRTRVMIEFQSKLGSLMDTLRRIPNHQIMRIVPTAGRYIDRFSQMFCVNGFSRSNSAVLPNTGKPNSLSLRTQSVRDANE